MKIATTVMIAFCFMIIFLVFSSENFKTLFKLILYSKHILLTPTPINLDENWLEITPNRPISAITGGACIYVDVSNSYSAISNSTYRGDILSRETLHSTFPDESLNAILLEEDGTRHVFNFTGSFAGSGRGQVSLILAGTQPTPENIKFIKVFIRSKIKIYNAKIIWVNSSL